MPSNDDYQKLVDGFDAAATAQSGMPGSMTVAAFTAGGHGGDSSFIDRAQMLGILGLAPDADRDAIADAMTAGGLDPARPAGGAFSSATTALDIMTNTTDFPGPIPGRAIGLDSIRDQAIVGNPALLELLPVFVRDETRKRLGIPDAAVAGMDGIVPTPETPTSVPKAGSRTEGSATATRSGTEADGDSIPASDPAIADAMVAGMMRETSPVRECLKAMATMTLRREGVAARRLVSAEPLFASLVRELLTDFPALIDCFPDRPHDPPYSHASLLRELKLDPDRLLRDDEGKAHWAAEDAQ